MTGERVVRTEKKGGGGGLLRALTPAALRSRFDEAVRARADLRVIDLILGPRAEEWLHSVGVVTDPAFVGLVPPFPPLDLRQIVSDHQLEMFLWTGFLDAREIAATIARHVDRAVARVLDFGAGCGRVARFLANAEEFVELFAADVNPNHVDWCRSNLRLAGATLAGLTPPLPYPDGSFDAVYAISVMTHLDAARADAWNRELQRVVAPGGIVILTTHGQVVLDRIAASATLQAYFRLDPAAVAAIRTRLGGEGHVFVRYDDDVLGRARAGADYGVSFTDLTHASSWWSSGGTSVVEARPAGLRGWQDVVVLRKPG